MANPGFFRGSKWAGLNVLPKSEAYIGADTERVKKRRMLENHSAFSANGSERFFAETGDFELIDIDFPGVRANQSN
jgi:hypothetical protein